MKKYAYVADDGMLKITTNLKTAIENGGGVETVFNFYKDNDNQEGGNPSMFGKEYFVYGDRTVRVGVANSPDKPLENFPELKELYDEVLKIKK